MRKFMMVAAAAAIALVGLSANTCGGDQKPAEPEAPAPAAPAEPPAAAPEAPAAAPEAAPAEPPAAPAQ